MNMREDWEQTNAYGAAMFGGRVVEEHEQIEPSEGSVMICVRLADNLISVVPGSTSTPCTECGEPCLLSPSGQKLIAKYQAKPVCMQCAGGVIGEEPVFSRLQPEQLDDIARHQEMEGM